ncbi:Heat shock transcription factor [Pseudogymnoascus australis]
MAQRQNGIIPHEYPGPGFNGWQQPLQPDQALKFDSRPTMAQRQDGIIPRFIIASDPVSSNLGGTNGPSTALFQQAVPVQHTQLAKRPAASRAPLFAMKLDRIVNDPKNDELIRWSERGDSFVVLDENVFAKLFRHKKYSSFVRQLNMHGFHKLVDPSEDSMKASERKNKSPSEYYNPCFKRGHPNLLRLIERKEQRKRISPTPYGIHYAQNTETHPSSERHIKMNISHIIEMEDPRTAHPPLASPALLEVILPLSTVPVSEQSVSAHGPSTLQDKALGSEFPNSHEELLHLAIKGRKRQSDLVSLQAFPKVRNLEFRAFQIPTYRRGPNRKAAVAYMVGELVEAPCSRCAARYGPFSECVR